MIELLCALVIGMILGFLLKKENRPPIIEILTNQVEKYEEDVAYYKKLCKTLSDENTEFRRKQK